MSPRPGSSLVLGVALCAFGIALSARSLVKQDYLAAAIEAIAVLLVVVAVLKKVHKIWGAGNSC